jgi:hypothetical protein
VIIDAFFRRGTHVAIIYCDCSRHCDSLHQLPPIVFLSQFSTLSPVSRETV